MSSAVLDREAITSVLDALDAAVDAAVEADMDMLSPPELLALLQRFEQVRRRLPVAEHRAINKLAREATPAELGGTLAHAVAEWTLTSRAEAARRVREAADLGERCGLTGEPLPPMLAATAAAQRRGRLGAGHVSVIRRFCHQLPGFIDLDTREHAETQLARLGTQYRPDQLAQLANRLADCLNPDGTYTDGTYTDDDRARRRGLALGNQESDGMSALRGWLTPETRATLEAVWAKLAAPGMCNPADDTPCVDGAPSQDAINRDARSAAQRHHDGLNAALRALLASGELGQHNGLPASIIVTTSLEDLEAAAGSGVTGGGTRLPINDVIRLGRHAHHYLAIFDEGNAVGLYHTKRLASPGQRIVLYAKDRGCSAPGCTVPGYYCEVHHITDYAQSHTTDIDDLTFACGPHHRMLKPRGWTTRRHATDDTEWIPPPHLDRGQPRTNTFHHPEKLLCEKDDEDAL